MVYMTAEGVLKTCLKRGLAGSPEGPSDWLQEVQQILRLASHSDLMVRSPPSQTPYTSLKHERRHNTHLSNVGIDNFEQYFAMLRDVPVETVSRSSGQAPSPQFVSDSLREQSPTQVCCLNDMDGEK